MVRLMLVLAPVMCILSGVAVSSLLNSYIKDIDPPKNPEKKSKKMVDNDTELKSQVRLTSSLILKFQKNMFHVTITTINKKWKIHAPFTSKHSCTICRLNTCWIFTMLNLVFESPLTWIFTCKYFEELFSLFLEFPIRSSM